MNIDLQIRKGLSRAFSEVFGMSVVESELSLQPTKPEFDGTFTLVVFPYIKHTKKSPEETGKMLGEFLKKELSEISDFNVVKGFLNIAVSPQTWVKVFSETICGKDF